MDATQFYDEDMLYRATEWKEEESRPPPGIHRSLAQDFDAAYQEQQQALARAASPVDGPCMETLIEDAEVEPDQVTEDAEEPECSSPLCGPMPLAVVPSHPVVPSEGEDFLQDDGEAEPFSHQHQVQLRVQKQAAGRSCGRGRGGGGRGRGRGRGRSSGSGDKEEDEDLVTPNARGLKCRRRHRWRRLPEPVEPKPKRAKAAAKKGAAKRAMKRPAARSVAENSGAAEEQPIEDGAVDNAIEPSGPIEDVAVRMRSSRRCPSETWLSRM